jgi:hypothetical protein
MIDKGLTYAYAEGGPVASEGRPRPNPFVRPMPILYFGPDGQPDGKPVYDNITVGGPAVLPPAAASDLLTRIPVGDLFPQQPVLTVGPDGQPVYGGIFPQPPVEPVVPPPEVMPIEPGDLFPQQPVLTVGPDGQPVYGGIFPQPPVEPVVPPPEVMPIEPGGDFGLPPPVQPVVPPPIQPVVPPPVTGPDGTSRTYSPPIFSRPSAADTRAAGYDAAIQRFANSPFVRPEGIMGLQRGKLRLS